MRGDAARAGDFAREAQRRYEIAAKDLVEALRTRVQAEGALLAADEPEDDLVENFCLAELRVAGAIERLMRDDRNPGVE